MAVALVSNLKTTMKPHTDLLYIFFDIGVIALFLIMAYKSQQSDPVPLDSTDQEKPIFVSDILEDTMAFAAEEDTGLQPDADKSIYTE